MVLRLSALRTFRLYPAGNNPGTHFCQTLSRPQGHSAIGRILCQWKIPLTLSRIEPATFRFVAQRLNHCATAVSNIIIIIIIIIITITIDSVRGKQYKDLSVFTSCELVF